MLKRLNKIRREEGGFTLVEMLVVVSIIGVLASVAVVAVGGMSTNSKEAACKADLAAAQTASDTYMAEHDGDPAASLAALETAEYLRGYSAKTVDADGWALVYDADTGTVTTAADSACSA